MVADELIPDGYERALRQVAPLASLRPTATDVRQLYEGLVLQAVAEVEGAIEPVNIRQSIRGDTGVSLPIDTVVETVGELVRRGTLEESEGHHVQIPRGIRAGFSERGRELTRARDALILDWLAAIDDVLRQGGARPLDTLERLALAEDLQLFVLQLVRYHGAELVAFLYPDAAGTSAILEIDEHDLFAMLPNRTDRVRMLRRTALPAFVREASGERATYLTGLFFRATLLQVLNADVGAAALFKDVIEPKVYYLDTNFAMRLLGFQGSALQDAAVEGLRLAIDTGGEMRVSTRTFEELEHTTKRQSLWVDERGDIPRPLAGVAADFIAGNDYVSAYWRDRAMHGISGARFRERKRNIPLLLENQGVAIVTEAEEGILDSREYREAFALLRQFKTSDPIPVVEHDAYHKVLIERLRTSSRPIEPQGWYDTNFVFVTFDHRLPPFAARASKLERGHRVPFCIMATELLQLLHFIRPQTEIPDETFLSLVNSPYLQRYFSARAVDKDLVREIMLTMEEVGELRPAVARKLLADRSLLSRISGQDEGTARKAVIREEIQQKAQRVEDAMEGELKKKEEQIAALKDKLKRLENSVANPTAETGTSDHGRRQKSPKAWRRKLRRLQRRAKEIGQTQEEQRAMAFEIAAMRGQISSLEEAHVSARRTHGRMLLVLPVVMAVYGVGLLPASPALAVAMIATGGLTVLWGVLRRFQSKFWTYLARTVNGAVFISLLVDNMPEAVRMFLLSLFE